MDDRDYQYQQYELYREANPNEKISYSKWKLRLKILKKQESHRESIQRLTNKKLYWESKCAELRESLKQLKEEHKIELKEVKQTRNVKWIRKVKVTKNCDCGSREKRDMLNKPLDKLAKKSSVLLKLILGTQSVLGEQKINANELQILCLSTLVEYLDLNTTMSWLELRRTTVFNSLQHLTKLGYLTTINTKAVNGKKMRNKYYLNTIGQEYLQGAINKISRRTYNIIK